MKCKKIMNRPMKLKIFNTMGRALEEVEPIDGDVIRIYSCGLTVYDYAHIGNLRKYVFDDLLSRALHYFGYKVKWVMNITDVGHLTSDADEGEDKIEKGAKREGKDAFEIARFYEKAFLDDIAKLNIKLPDVLPRATDHIDEQVAIIKSLESKGFTYKTTDGIYFDTSRLPDYGKLANLDIENLKEGARVEKNQQKKSPTDFVLWKFSYPEGRELDTTRGDSASRRQMEWPSSWGIGFPGWHLECSAMSTKYLGQPFEIHTGGIDHIPVHHTNEIAQSEASEGKPLAKYWVHSEHLLENGKKMAKSQGHFIRLKDVQERGFDPLDLRFFYLRAHYRSKIDFSWESLEGASRSRERILNFVSHLSEGKSEGEEDFFASALKEFEVAISEDLNTPRALEVIFETISSSNTKGFTGHHAKHFFQKVEQILAIGLFTRNAREILVENGKKVLLVGDANEETIGKIIQMSQEKTAKNYDQSDRLRSELSEAGYRIEETLDSFKIAGD